MGDSDGGGGKSTLVQAPQKQKGPGRTGASQTGFTKGRKKAGAMTAADFKMEKGSPPARHGASVPKLKYPNAQRNEACLCGSGKKFKKCCIDALAA